MQEPVDSDDNKSGPAGLSTQDEDDIIESDLELDDTDVVEPDNDPPQKACFLCPDTLLSLILTFLAFCFTFLYPDYVEGSNSHGVLACSPRLKKSMYD